MPLNSAQLIATGQLDGFRNRIINGDMRIDQRNSGASVTLTASVYTLDRWNASVTSSSKLSVQQNAGSVTPPAGYTNYIGFTSLSAYSVLASDAFTLLQSVEGLNVQDLAWGTASASPVTLSFWVRSSLTGSFGGSIRNSGNTRSYPFSYTISSSNTWEYKTVTIPGDTTGTWLTTNGIGLQLAFGLGVGSTFSGTAGAWASSNFNAPTGAVSVVGTNGATFYLTGVQLEKGPVATNFDFRGYEQELALCQRYWQKYNFYFSITDTGLATNSQRYWHWGWPFPVQFRASPTVSPTGTTSIGGVNSYNSFNSNLQTSNTNQWRNWIKLDNPNLGTFQLDQTYDAEL